ncbi:MAG TPA: prepilin-type N-terminal cleavage/methylation domain-containing protein [Phycisphaerae bacterium]|nr:prepilin-type N-terminal cleavage/methylation domain-containing protein [Phycisphaerae bacterium]
MKHSQTNRFAGSGIGERGFTLIELLVAIATITLLIGILLPALGRAREAGRGSYCAGLLHNAALATSMYLDDNEGSFWPYYVDVPGAGGGRRWWFGFEPGGPPSNPNQKHRFLDKPAGLLGTYFGDEAKELRCSSFPYGRGKYFPKFSPPAGGYGYNTAALGGYNTLDPANSRVRRVQQFGGRTSEVFIFADGIHFDRLSFSGSVPLEQTFNEPAYIQWQDPTAFNSNAGVNGGFGHFRHLGRANVLFLDGHAAAQPLRHDAHPYSAKGYGPVANLSDEALRTLPVRRGNREWQVDVIYGLP